MNDHLGAVAAIWIVAVLAVCAFWGMIGYVAWHFIAKFW